MGSCGLRLQNMYRLGAGVEEHSIPAGDPAAVARSVYPIMGRLERRSAAQTVQQIRASLDDQLVSTPPGRALARTEPQTCYCAPPPSSCWDQVAAILRRPTEADKRHVRRGTCSGILIRMSMRPVPGRGQEFATTGPVVQRGTLITEQPRLFSIRIPKPWFSS